MICNTLFLGFSLTILLAFGSPGGIKQIILGDCIHYEEAQIFFWKILPSFMSVRQTDHLWKPVDDALCKKKNQKNPYYKTYFKKRIVHTFFNNIKHKNVKTIRCNTKEFYDQISKVTVLIRSVNIRTDILKCSVGSF